MGHPPGDTGRLMAGTHACAQTAKAGGRGAGQQDGAHRLGAYDEEGNLPESRDGCRLTPGPSGGSSPSTTSSPPSNASACAPSTPPRDSTNSSKLQNQDTDQCCDQCRRPILPPPPNYRGSTSGSISPLRKLIFALPRASLPEEVLGRLRGGTSMTWHVSPICS